jgi:hypothetical protein
MFWLDTNVSEDRAVSIFRVEDQLTFILLLLLLLLLLLPLLLLPLPLRRLRMAAGREILLRAIRSILVK